MNEYIVFVWGSCGHAEIMEATEDTEAQIRAEMSKTVCLDCGRSRS